MRQAPATSTFYPRPACRTRLKLRSGPAPAGPACRPSHSCPFSTIFLNPTGPLWAYLTPQRLELPNFCKVTAGRVTRVQCIFKVAQPRLSRAGPACPAGMQTDKWQCRGSSIRPAMLAGDGEGAVGSGAWEGVVGAPHGGRGRARGAPAGPAQHSLATQGHQRTEPAE